MWHLRPVEFRDIAGWRGDDHLSALRAFSRQPAPEKPAAHRTGLAGIDPECLSRLREKAREDAAQRDPRAFFERQFRPHAVLSADGARGFVTAFYEPEIAASREPRGRFRVPFHRRPDDLVKVDGRNRPDGWDPSIRFARRETAAEIAPYHDRRAIHDGALDGRGLEIAWVEDRVDAFFAHVQGAARLRLADGTLLRVTYDGKSGHPFTAIGRILVERGEIPEASIGMASIRAWLAADPVRGKALMEENRSYIFFREQPVDDPNDGPVAAAKVPLTAGRSLAVDRSIHTFGVPVFVKADIVNRRPWRRLMIAQDTGSAIVGAARGDLFMGSGDDAGRRAGDVRSPADFFLLVPKDARLDPARCAP